MAEISTDSTSGLVSEVILKPVLETHQPSEPSNFLHGKMDSVYCHNIKWDLNSPVDPPKCLLDGDEIDERSNSPANVSSTEEMVLELDESQESQDLTGNIIYIM